MSEWRNEWASKWEVRVSESFFLKIINEWLQIIIENNGVGIGTFFNIYTQFSIQNVMKFLNR